MGPVVLSNAPIVYVIFRSVIYSPLSLEVVENPNKCKSFLAPLFGGATTPIFYGSNFRTIDSLQVVGQCVSQLGSSDILQGLNAQTWPAAGSAVQ